MQVLVVYAHPNPESFNQAILKAFTDGLEAGGHTFKVVDLYAIQFDPTLALGEFYSQWMGEPLPADTQEQQAKLTQADGLAFIYPVWWWRGPAVLHGWVDRVLAPGCAYQLTGDGMEGLLGDKKALFINTTMAAKEFYDASGVGDAMQRITSAVFTDACGIQDLEHVFFYALHNADDETRKGYLESAYRLGVEF